MQNKTLFYSINQPLFIKKFIMFEATTNGSLVASNIDLSSVHSINLVGTELGKDKSMGAKR